MNCSNPCMASRGHSINSILTAGIMRQESGRLRFLFQLPVENKGPERNERSDESAGRFQQRPFTLEGLFQKGDHKQDKKQSMKPAAVFYRLGKPRKIFQGHGDKHQEEVGNTFGNGNQTETSKGRGKKFIHDYVSLSLIIPLFLFTGRMISRMPRS